MNINIPDTPTMLVFGGLFFIFITLTKINGYKIKPIKGKNKYLFLVGVIVCTTGICLYLGVSVSTLTPSEDIPISEDPQTLDNLSTATLEETPTEIPEYTCNVVGVNYECESWSNEQYPLIDLFGEKYVPLSPNNEKIWNANINKLAKFVFEGDSRVIMKTGDSLPLTDNYTLDAIKVDADNEKVWLEFSYDSYSIDDEIIDVSGDDGNTWTATLDTLEGEGNVPVMKVHIRQIFQDSGDSIAQIDGFWLIDYKDTMNLRIGDRFGEYTLKKIVSGEGESNLGYVVFE